MKLKTYFVFLIVMVTTFAQASINMQMVNLNLQFKGKNKLENSDISMPFYQTAEIEKTIDSKDYLISINPKQGLTDKEVNLEIRLINPKNSKLIAKKEIKTSYNRNTNVSIKGLSFMVTPTI